MVSLYFFAKRDYMTKCLILRNVLLLVVDLTNMRLLTFFFFQIKYSVKAALEAVPPISLCWPTSEQCWWYGCTG